MTTPAHNGEFTPRRHREIEAKPYYNYNVRLLIDAYNAGLLPLVDHIEVEPRYGYVASVSYSDGGSRVIVGHDIGFNPGSSESLTKDKGYTKFMLRSMGVQCPEGEEFLLPWWADSLRQGEKQRQNPDMLDTSKADEYIRRQLEYPVYVKPVDGTQGVGVRKVHDTAELDDTFATYQQERVKVAVVEEALTMPDYRLLMFDGVLQSAYERQPLSVTGTGSHSVRELLEEKDALYKQQERYVKLHLQLPSITRSLGRRGLTLESIIPESETVPLLDVSNLSMGGVPLDVTNEIHPHWEALSARIARKFNLRICGIDLACEDITRADSNYSIIELNSTPGVHQFMASQEDGHEKAIAMFAQLFGTPS